MSVLEKINIVLFEADLFCTSCKVNTGMEDEYKQVAACMLEEGIGDFNTFTQSLDFWMWKGFTAEQSKAKETYRKIKQIMENADTNKI